MKENPQKNIYTGGENPTWEKNGRMAEWKNCGKPDAREKRKNGRIVSEVYTCWKVGLTD